MRAVVVHEFGGPEAMVVQEWPRPSAGPGEVLVRVRAASVNFADHLQRRGTYRGDSPPLIPGMELAGEVVQLGSSCGDLQVGQRVFGWARQSYAEYAAVAAWRLLPMPERLSFEEAASVPVVFSTAWSALVPLARVQPGERVLIHAVGSGVGSAAVQIARELGARVLVTAGSDWKLERGRELGAEAGINYLRVENLTSEIQRLTAGEGVDVVLEGIGRPTFGASLQSLRSRGRMVIYGAPGGARVELDTRLAIFRNLSLFGLAITSPDRLPQTIQEFRDGCLKLLSSGRVRPIIDQVYPLEQVAEAHHRLLDREQFGKIVLRIA